MSQRPPDHDSASPMRAPYDPEPDMGEGPDDISWKPPVIAAMAGALAVAIFVIYAIVTGPGVDEVSNDEVTSSAADSLQPTDDLPPGYVLVTEEAGARVESFASVPSATLVFVSTAVPGSVGTATVSQLDVAYWELETSTGTLPMKDQLALVEVTGSDLGYFTVGFSPDVSGTVDELRAYVVDGVAGELAVLELPPDLPARITDFRIDIGDGVVVVVDSLQIEIDGGYVEWHVEGGLTARLDVVVRDTGTGGSGLQDAALVPEYAGNSLLDPSTGTEATPRLYSFGSQYRLVQVGPPLDPDNPLSVLSVEFRVTAVTSVADAVPLPIDAE